MKTSLAASKSRLKRIDWKIRIEKSAHEVWTLLSTDAGREKFLAEKSRTDDDRIDLIFPNGVNTTTKVVESVFCQKLTLDYFGAPTTFNLTASGTGVVVHLISMVSEAEHAEISAGWVSVLLSLKAASFGVDLRNHNPAYSWNNGFADN